MNTKNCGRWTIKPSPNLIEVVTMKSIPNLLSISRILFSLMMLLVEPLGPVFLILYLICGLTDMLDGFIARKTGTTSIFGAKLDSIADLTMIVVLLIILIPIIKPSTPIISWIIVIGLIRITSMMIAWLKYKTFASIHTYANKITGLLLFLFPIMLPVISTTVWMNIICSVATLSALEEIMIQLTSSKLHLNRKSVFLK